MDDEIRRVWAARGEGEGGEKGNVRTEQQQERGLSCCLAGREENIVTGSLFLFLAAHGLADEKTQMSPAGYVASCQFIS
ncbi:hypothetical protein KVR01_003459 [Diaporthe batatas]|uniref:uncharacterized protein n=1 Tax=Diaporthe batatas TaxID=748121 RepID=UPI001D04CEB5|nr:uncharacterized protein KVR01_003459 [Diaporthe batatas]KAG8167770.1 hypothetical protein KVR01_003459 [Diaporthe batatas]